MFLKPFFEAKVQLVRREILVVGPLLDFNVFAYRLNVLALL
jgi:hypothetical protein